MGSAPLSKFPMDPVIFVPFVLVEFQVVPPAASSHLHEAEPLGRYTRGCHAKRRCLVTNTVH